MPVLYTLQLLRNRLVSLSLPFLNIPVHIIEESNLIEREPSVFFSISLYVSDAFFGKLPEAISVVWDKMGKSSVYTKKPPN